MFVARFESMYGRRTKIILVTQIGEILYRVTKSRNGVYWLMEYDTQKNSWGKRRITSHAELVELGLAIAELEAA